MKNISFWCIILFIVVLMFLDHFLSNKPIIEGAKVDMNDVSKLKITLKGPQNFVERVFQKNPGELGELSPDGQADVSLELDAELNGNGQNNVQTLEETTEIPSCGPGSGLVKTAPNGVHNQGCERLNTYNESSETLCNNAFEISDDGTYTKCKWSVSENTCSPDKQCNPETAGDTNIPYCLTRAWQPGHHLGARGTETDPIAPYCYCRDGTKGTNHTSEGKSISRCLMEDQVTRGILPAWMNDGRLSTQPGTDQTQQTDQTEPVECQWPQVRDEDNNVCVDAPPIADGTVRVHQRCIEDSDCMTGRCAGPTGDPGCYGKYTCTGPRRPEHGGPSYEERGDNATSRMAYCGGVQSASGNP